jgi:hypothetical protein
MNTPRTEAAARHIDGFADKWVPQYVSEELERELQEANDYADRLVEHKDMVCLPADLSNLREANAHFAIENEMLKNAIANDRDAARAEGIQMEEEIKTVTEQRDEWKANHDNQVSINKLLRDRPDLKDRAASVDKLIEQRDSLQAQLEEAIETKNMATETLSAIKEKYGLGPRNVMKELKHKVSELEKVLKDCLYAMPCSYVPNHTVANLPAMIASQAQMLGEECNRADAMIKLNEILCQFMNDELKMSLADPRLIKLQSIVDEKIKKPDDLNQSEL